MPRQKLPKTSFLSLGGFSRAKRAGSGTARVGLREAFSKPGNIAVRELCNRDEIRYTLTSLKAQRGELWLIEDEQDDPGGPSNGSCKGAVKFDRTRLGGAEDEE